MPEFVHADGDADDAFDAGDEPVEAVDWDAVALVQARIDDANDPATSTTHLEVLTELYGDDLEIR